MTMRYQYTQDPGAVIWINDDTGQRGSLVESGTGWDRYLADKKAGATILPADPPPVVYSGDAAIASKVRTTDATPTEVYRATLAPQTGYAAVLTLIGVDGGNGAVRVVRASIAAKRLNAGALLVGAPVVLASHADAAALTWTQGASVSGNDFVVTCAGAAGRTIDWSISGSVLSFTPAGR